VGQELSIVGWVEGPLALAAELRGINALMMDFIEDEAFVGDLLDFCAEVAIAYAPPQIEAGADTIGMSDAAASMIGPDLYERLLFPRQQRVYRSIKDRYPQVLTRSHMCGNTTPLAGTMNRLLADIFEIDFPASLREVRRLMPERLISGNISTITDMIQGTPQTVYHAAEQCHGICGKRHIVNCGCEVSPITPPENLKAMIRYAREHRP
jgi:MtaA/CmuA family methyltransferase